MKLSNLSVQYEHKEMYALTNHAVYCINSQNYKRDASELMQMSQ